jgi:hypothetical protein
MEPRVPSVRPPSTGPQAPILDEPKDIGPERGRQTIAKRYWLERAVDATLLANSMPTAKLKAEVAHIAVQLLKLADTDAAPVKLRKRRKAR